ncbi:MAG: TlpA family protein disulfide reductase, partial [Candidatus Heimdallarchaeaceae archaeon]
MKISHLSLITFSALLIVVGIMSPIIYYQTCDNCRTNPPDNNLTNGQNNETTVWDSVYFTLLNGSVIQTKYFLGQKLLIEFASSNCIHCLDQLDTLRKLNDLITQNDKSIVVLTLLIDLIKAKELLTYYINQNITWELGMVNYGNYTLVDLTVVPTFFLLNQTGHEVNQNEGIMSLSQLSDFL